MWLAEGVKNVQELGVNARPTIFVSTVTKELRGARQLVANTLTFLGYEPVWQDIFGTESGDLRQMLRERINGCKGVVQIVGYAYGAEPLVADEEFGRVSYTQYEALYARKKGIKVWYLFIDEKFPADVFEAEPEELRDCRRDIGKA
jgi:ABC-type cobalt transport system substrate-binding protein